MSYLLVLFFVTIWQKTRSFRELFLFAGCRFYPSCSDYFIQSVKKHGLTSGSIFSLQRICKCHPFCEGGIDEVHP
ncbi:MAG: membrane protein insertion efficiency factor YidD [Candidatus Melainabacteria bacterium RIFCSPHIGHO2_02_FULL_34_12]|nr:MAG: membrane protein insertion efficiency factor YidD [Candidatus Melainabacteria bacterium RIFCSPHIGHO2_02_FULL_34_12]